MNQPVDYVHGVCFVCFYTPGRYPTISITFGDSLRFEIYLRPIQRKAKMNVLLPAATKLGQGNKFTGVCVSTRGGCLTQIFGGGCLTQIFGGGLTQIFGGCLTQIFGGVSHPNFRGGVCSKFSGGVSDPNFRGGCLTQILGGMSAQNFQGGCLKFFFFFFSNNFLRKKILLGCTASPPETVNARPVRILLECILVLFIHY